MNQSEKFWDRIAERYSRRPIADEEAYEKKLQITQEYFKPDMEVLEFGCGTGSTALRHAPHVRHILAIDLSAKMIEIARGKADERNVKNVTFQQSTIDEFSAEDQTLDAVLGLSILHLLDDMEEVITKVHRMLKPGGIFVSSTACIGDRMGFLKLVLPLGAFFGVIPSVKVFTTQELEQSLTGAGFEIDRQWQPGKGKAVFIVARRS